MYSIKQTDMLQELQKIPKNSIDCLVTDPPYKIVQGGVTKPLGGMFGNVMGGVLNRQMKNVRTGGLFDHNDIKFADWLCEVYRVLKPKSHAYIFCSGRRLNELTTEALKAGFIFQNLLVWKKQNVTPNKWYMNQCEFILMLRKGGAKPINNMGSTTCLEFLNPTGNKTHPTEKPVDLLKHLILNSTNKGETVLDPFMGTGNTGIACIDTGRNFIGYEIDKKFFLIAEEKLNFADKENQNEPKQEFFNRGNKVPH